ncbi:MAG: hypothetical protein HYT94_00535 [Parcubacteria group bacterium]|nr:hypothetical protein [Parcubacteria group bacterium]
MNSFIVIVQNSFQVLLNAFAGFAPNLVVAVFLVMLGVLVGTSFEKVISQSIRLLKVDELLEAIGLRAFLIRGGLRLDAGLFLGGLVKWFIIIGFLMAGLQAAGLSGPSTFLGAVLLSYIPQVIIATLMLLFAAVGAKAVKKAIINSASALGAPAAHLLGAMASSSIWIGTIIFVLSQLGIAPDFMKILFIGIVAMFSLAGGLAFGLGGKDAAAELIASVSRHLSGKR